VRLAAALVLLISISRAATLADRVREVLERPAARGVLWGVKVVDLGSGETLYELNAEKLFIPASNTKLFSTALALVRLGPEYRFLTRVAAEGPPDPAGRISGDLVLVGGGDPNLSRRALPYEKKQEFTAPDPLEELAAEVAALGVRRVEGAIVGDDTRYLWQPYAIGWAIEDAANGDGPPVTALSVYDNVVALKIRPGGRAEWDAPAAYYQLDNRILPGAAESRIRIHRPPGDRTVHVWGEMSAKDPGRAELLAIDDPALYAAQAFRDALVRHGIVVVGEARSRHAFPWDLVANLPPGYSLASRSSMPLIEDLRVINKVSQNLHAEIVVRETARERRGAGSWEASDEERKAFLSEIGLRPEEYFLRDGSGLSRQNLVSPGAVIALLAYMWRSPHKEAWLETLPIAGVDGSLQARFLATPAAEILRAKTGTLTHVSALSGYIDAPDGRRLAFSVFANNYSGDAARVRGIIDRLSTALFGASVPVSTAR